MIKHDLVYAPENATPFTGKERQNKKSQASFKQLIIAVTAAILPAALILCSGWLRASIVRSMRLCAVTVIPALFPFIIANEFFTYSGAAQTLGKPLDALSRRIFGLGGGMSAAILTGLVCGYPAGAACAFGLYKLGACSPDEAERCAAFSNNAGPAFVIGGIGGAMLGDVRLGVIIWGSTVAVSMAAGVMLRGFSGRTARGSLTAISPSDAPPPAERHNFTLAGMIADSALVMLKICALIITFSAAADAAGQAVELLDWGGAAGALARGIFELTSAADYAARELPPRLAAVIIAAITGFSGLCVHFQTASLCPPELSLRRYYIVKLLSAPASAALCAAFIWMFLH